LVRLYLDRTAAHDTLDELGKVGCLQLEDLNSQASAFQRAYAGEVKRCDEMLRRIRFFEANIAQEPDLQQILEDAKDELAVRETYATDSLSLDDLDSRLASTEVAIRSILQNQHSLESQYYQLSELRAVLEKAGGVFQSAPMARSSEYGSLARDPDATAGDSSTGAVFAADVESHPSTATDPRVTERLLRPGSTVFDNVSGLSLMLSYYTGVVPVSRQEALERTLFRATRGNCFVKFVTVEQPLMDPETREPEMKAVYVILYSGAQAKNKIAKILAAFGDSKYPFGETAEEQQLALTECRSRLDDLKTVLDQTRTTSRETLSFVAGKVPAWKRKVMREKAVFHSMNLLNWDTSSKLFIAEGWCPAFAVDDVRVALTVGKQRSRVQMDSMMEVKPVSSAHGKVHPPTYFRTNRFTEVFQGIVESYGVASYKELNPAVFTVVSFPFLFAVMFGDVGHGIIMALVAAYVISLEKKVSRSKLDEMTLTVFDGRYIIFLMGLFSIFTGLIYNEFFAVPLDFFGSRWRFTSASEMACGVDNCMNPAAVMPPLSPYPFGFDPVWKSTSTALLFFNSYKMKLSIVLGVAQMVMGICCSYANATHFKEPVDVWYVFVPQMIFMNATFGYLVVLIFIKWLTDWNAPGAKPAPDLKAVMIGMFMSPGSVPPELQLYPGQAFVQAMLLLLALIAIPWMLIPKPLILKRRYEARISQKYRILVDDEPGGGVVGEKTGLFEASTTPSKAGDAASMEKGSSAAVQAEAMDISGSEDEEEFDFSEVVVHQMIHTIEFVLGAVSNTASYLRLWALSLAHAELSDVFLEKLLYMTIGTGSSVAIAIGFFLWAGATIGVLMLMESLSAFLHALRLHWVEFQNKFYNQHGDGVKFAPFDFNALDPDAA